MYLGFVFYLFFYRSTRKQYSIRKMLYMNETLQDELIIFLKTIFKWITSVLFFKHPYQLLKNIIVAVAYILKQKTVNNPISNQTVDSEKTSPRHGAEGFSDMLLLIFLDVSSNGNSHANHQLFGKIPTRTKCIYSSTDRIQKNENITTII